MGVDPTGTWDWGVFWDFIIQFVAVAAGIVVGAVVCVATTVVGIVIGEAIGLVTSGPAGIMAGAALGAGIGFVAGLALGVSAAMATTGLINNTANAIYYNHISDGTSSLHNAPKWDDQVQDYIYSDDTYAREGYVNRWKRLDYAKAATQEAGYFGNAQRFYAEYSFHMVAWGLTSWAYNKNIPFISGLAESANKAAVFKQNWDSRCSVNFFTGLFMILGW